MLVSIGLPTLCALFVLMLNGVYSPITLAVSMFTIRFIEGLNYALI